MLGLITNLVLSSAPVAAQTLEEAIALWRSGADDAGALDQLLAFAEAGEAEAAYLAAQSYDFGYGVAPDGTAAERLYRRALDGGMADAGDWLAQGLVDDLPPIPDDPEAALAVAAQVAAIDPLIGERTLGRVLTVGPFAQARAAEGMDALRRAAAARDFLALRLVAQGANRGIGMAAPDFTEAMQADIVALLLEPSRGRLWTLLAFAISEGSTSQGPNPLSVPLDREAPALGNWVAAYNLADVHARLVHEGETEADRPDPWFGNPTEAVMLCRLAASLATEPLPPEGSCADIEGLLRDTPHWQAGLDRYQVAHGDPSHAETSLGALLELWEGGWDDDVAFGLLERAAEAGTPRAMAETGRAYQFGWGVAADPAVAIAWFDAAVAAGDPHGAAYLAVAPPLLHAIADRQAAGR